MAVINYDGNNDYLIDYGWYPEDSTPTTTVNITYNVTCPNCNMWILNYQWFQFCPYCGKPLYPKADKKAKILKRLGAILKEVEDIKELFIAENYIEGEVTE